VPGLAEEERSLRPADIALLYRALRKGREDSKDEPGAADFYYGELEMRRHDRTASWPERVVLWLYWLVAGYGLRATRALSCLLGLLVVATVLLAVVGFKPAPSAAPLTATIAGTPPQQRILFTATPQPAMTAEWPLPDRLGTAALVAAEGAVFRTLRPGVDLPGQTHPGNAAFSARSCLAWRRCRSTVASNANPARRLVAGEAARTRATPLRVVMSTMLGLWQAIQAHGLMLAS
jgi:hypothetical protein